MMAIIISDIHGDIEKARAFLSYRPEAEHIVLGDLVDNVRKGITLDDELACLDLLFSSNTKTLWGNHDLAYTKEMPWRCNTGHELPDEDILQKYIDNSRYLQDTFKLNGHVSVRDILTDRFVANKDRMRVAYTVDGWLCTHAGVGPEMAELIPPDVIAGGQSDIVEWLEEEFKRELVPVPLRKGGRPQRYGRGPLFQIPPCRFGRDQWGGIFWYDAHGEMTDPSPRVGKQIFGHTPVPWPERTDNWINLNTFEEGIWVFDTETDQLVDLLDDLELAGLANEQQT